MTAVRIRHHGERIRRREVRRALRRLESQGELTERQRAAVQALGERLVDRLLAGPEAGLEAADDEDAARMAASLFG